MVVLLLGWLRRVNHFITASGLGLIIGGAVGNVIDRARFGAVIDFLDFHALGWHWPAFNVADSAIFVGAVLLLVDGLLMPHRDSTQRSVAAPRKSRPGSVVGHGQGQSEYLGGMSRATLVGNRGVDDHLLDAGGLRPRDRARCPWYGQAVARRVCRRQPSAVDPAAGLWTAAARPGPKPTGRGHLE